MPTCTNTTLAFGTAAPVASCTTPVTLPLNCAKETLAEKATTTNTKKQRNAVVNLIQIPPLAFSRTWPARKTHSAHRHGSPAGDRPGRDQRDALPRKQMQAAPPLSEKTFTYCCAQFTSVSQMLSSRNLDAIVLLRYARVWRRNSGGLFRCWSALPELTLRPAEERFGAA